MRQWALCQAVATVTGWTLLGVALISNLMGMPGLLTMLIGCASVAILLATFVMSVVYLIHRQHFEATGASGGL